MPLTAKPILLWLARTCTRLAWSAVMAMGLLVLLGWLLENDLLKRLLFETSVPMNPLTALSFFLAGAALCALEQQSTARRRRGLGLALGAVVALIALAKLLDYYFTLSLGIDQLLFYQKLGSSLMAPSTAYNLLFVGLALDIGLLSAGSDIQTGL